MMWKHLTRGFCESLERQAYHANFYSQNLQNNNSGSRSTKKHHKFVICNKKFITSSFSVFYQEYCGITRHLVTQDKNNQNKYDAKYNWSEAVGWSSVLAVSYVVCQSFCIQRKLFKINNVDLENEQNKFIDKPLAQISRLLSQLLPIPKYILPLSRGSINPRAVIGVLGNDVSVDVDGTSSIEQVCGPITAEEAFKEAVDEFTCSHETILGKLAFNYGTKAIEEEQYEEAIEHFMVGSNLSSSESMFNLGLCYELGLGTSTDHGKAMKYYEKAAVKGHADAMYNLGVCHAQGKAGLKTNLKAARSLFTEAAQKGQIQALEAIKSERSFKIHSNIKYSTKHQLETKSINNKFEINVTAKLINYKIFMTDLNNQIAESNQCISSYNKNIDMKNPRFLSGYDTFS